MAHYDLWMIETGERPADDVVAAVREVLSGVTSGWLQVCAASRSGIREVYFTSDSQPGEKVPVPGGMTEEAFVTALRSRFAARAWIIHYSTETQAGNVLKIDADGSVDARTFESEELPARIRGVLEGRGPVEASAWVGAGPPDEEGAEHGIFRRGYDAPPPPRPKSGTLGYDKPLEDGSYVGAFQAWEGSAIEAVAEEVGHGETGELTISDATGSGARIYLERGRIVGIVVDGARGQLPQDVWAKICALVPSKRRLRRGVIQPRHVDRLQLSTEHLLRVGRGEEPRR
ncbi:MAG: hypothetical protein HYY06_13480 [Deltaproteobacteria bacterium]|nr:hypothetical protein [Deltaproteobacteria bacterium]